jgi:cytochrome c5
MTNKPTGVMAALAILALAGGLTTAALAKPVSFTLPPESSTLKNTGEPGFTRAEQVCVTCHSRDYITTQPRGKGKAFWAAEVSKMVTVYAAPVLEPDRAAIAEYLAANY